MEWLAENAQNGYFLLGFAAVMLAGVWWIQKQVVYLAGAGVALVALLVFWLVIRNVPTTATRIETDLNALAKALLDKDEEKAFRYVGEDFKYMGKHRDKWFPALQKLIADDQVDKIEVKEFKLKKHSGKDADVDFRLEARHKNTVLFARDCPWKMTREGDAWQVTKVSLHGGKKSSED